MTQATAILIFIFAWGLFMGALTRVMMKKHPDQERQWFFTIAPGLVLVVLGAGVFTADAPQTTFTQKWTLLGTAFVGLILGVYLFPVWHRLRQRKHPKQYVKTR